MGRYNHDVPYVALYPQLKDRGEGYSHWAPAGESTDFETLIKGLAWEIFAVRPEEVDYLLALHEPDDSELFEAMRDLYHMQACVLIDDVDAMPLPDMST